MTITIEATYQNGVFVPDTRVDLADHARVRLIVERPTAGDALDIVRRRCSHRIQIRPDDARAIADSPEFLPEES